MRERLRAVISEALTVRKALINKPDRIRVRVRVRDRVRVRVRDSVHLDSRQ
jgi:hypothetical protein